jgi:site-specific DNA-cytosine methylase
MNVLELFSGTGSVGKCCKKLDWSWYSVDLEFDADFKGDIMDFDYKQFPKDWFDVIWASPPCTNYSKLQDGWLGRMRKGKIYTREIQEQEMKEDDKLVQRVFEIIDYFQPEYWFIENPASSRMKDRPFMKDINNYVVDYCMYCDWGYRKRTRIWTNRTDFKPLVCDGKGTCGNMVNTQHKKVLGNGYEMIDGKKVLVNTKQKRLLHKTNLGNTERKKRTLGNGTTQQDRYRVPEDLIFSLLLE